MLQCKQCGVAKDEIHFYQGKNSRQFCKDCRREQSRLWAINNPQKAKLRDERKRRRYRDRNRVTVSEKRCGKCGQTKAADAFPVGRDKSTGLHSNCRECSARYSREYNLQHPGRSVWRYSRTHDRKRHLQTAPLEIFTALIGQSCTYCTLTPARGVDRIDNARGHEADNMVPCCQVCNTARNNIWSVDAMKQYLGPAIRAAREAGALV